MIGMHDDIDPWRLVPAILLQTTHLMFFNLENPPLEIYVTDTPTLVKDDNASSTSRRLE